MTSDARYLSKDFLTEFINIYRSYPCLWQIKSKDYTNKNLKNKAYEKLVEFSKKSFPDANREFVTKKIQNLRAAFRKEIKNVENSKRSGTSAEDVYEPTLWYYNLLLFTLDTETALESLDNINSPESQPSIEDETGIDKTETENENQDDEEIEVISTQIFRKPTEPSRGRKLKTREQTAKDLQSFVNVCTQALSKSERLEEYDAVGANVAAKLRKMDPNQACLAEALLNKVLFKGTLKQLTLNTKVTEVPAKQSYVYQGQQQPLQFVSSPMSSSSSGSGTCDYYENIGQIFPANNGE